MSPPRELTYASHSGTAGALARVRLSALSLQTWLSSSNPYRSDTVAELGRQQAAGTLQPAQVADYVAVSGPLHCADGWSYLGRAMDSHLRNHADVARHLAYYAELRGAMALLATEGVGIFNNQHFVVDAAGDARSVRSSAGTHVMTDLALGWWADQPSAGALLSGVVAPADHSLAEWVSAFTGSATATISAVARALLLEWGLDIKLLASDRVARNEASYRPSEVMSRGSLPLPDALAFCRNIWAMLDPQGVGQFAVLDMHLLRRTLIMLSRRAKVAGNAYRTQASTSVDVVLGSEDSAIQELYRGFLLTSGGGSPLLQEAASNSMSSPRHHLQVMARASLLLRLATGAAQRLLRDAGVRPTDIDFWISGLAEANGLWSTPADRPRQLTDLYEDVMTALDEIQTLDASGAPEVRLLSAWSRQTRLSTLTLGGMERVPVWAFSI